MNDNYTGDSVHVKSVDVGFLKGKINGVTVRVWSDFAEGNHTITFTLSTTGRDPEIKRNGHGHPWGEKLIHDVERYASDAEAARKEAWDELERRNLDDKEDWHDGS